MKRLFYALLTTLSVLVMPVSATATTAMTARTWADGRVFYKQSDEVRHTTTTVGDFALSFRDTLPEGTMVRMHFGFGGKSTIYDSTGPHVVRVSWEGLDEKDAEKVGPNTWTAKFRSALHRTGDRHHYDQLQFVVVVTLPDGTEYYVKGSESPLGYYEAELPGARGGSNDNTPLRRLRLVSVQRH